jgi:signal transduction histidine kinase
MRPAADILAAAVVVGVFWLPPVLSTADWRRSVGGLVLATFTSGSMALRRRFPAGATVVVGCTTVAGTLLGACRDPMLATAWCVYGLAVIRGSRARNLVLVLASLFGGLALVSAVPGGSAGGIGRRLVVAIAALSAAWLLGTVTGKQIATAREAERSRVQLETARDVHDLVGHALGVISAEAGVTLSIPAAAEQELRASLADIETHARNALEEVQALVRLLRSPSSRAEEVTTGVPDLESILTATRTAGVRVDARVAAQCLEGPHGTAVCRIVQEALSNVARHAPGAPCTVDVCTDDDVVVVCVRDRGPGTRTQGGTGFGLRGMRERAGQIGGTVAWRNHPEGGFEVTARLPMRSQR